MGEGICPEGRGRAGQLHRSRIHHDGYAENSPQDLLDKFADMTMLKRLGRPEEIASTALFLVSEEASYVTGQVLSVNGGMRL